MSRALPTALLVAALAATPAARAGENSDGGVTTAQVADGGSPPETLPEPAPAPIEEDHDLDRIPAELASPPPPVAIPAVPPARRRLHGRLFVEDAFTLVGPSRTILVPYPRQLADWHHRTSADLYLEWSPRRSVTITLSDRLTVLEQDGLDLWTRQTVRNDLREAFLSWEIAANTYVEAGRINLRNGAALGFSPTDFFKTRTLVGLASLDPSAMRNNRLGTLMARAQHIWSNGSATLAWAPKLTQPSRIVDDRRYGIDPRVDATNAAHRALGSVSVDLGGFSPQLLGYVERGRSKLGCNLSRAFGEAVVAYAEWAGGRETALSARALAYAQATESLPPALPLPADSRSAFRHDAAAGASWTLARRLTLNVEYHFHQAGFTRQDWQRWFDAGSSPLRPPLTAEMLWYIRGYASDQQEPLTRHQIFLRAAWPRAFVAELDLSGFALVDLYHGSTLAQTAASYYVSRHWTVAVFGSLNAGPDRSERGSMPRFGSLVLQVIVYP